MKGTRNNPNTNMALSTHTDTHNSPSIPNARGAGAGEQHRADGSKDVRDGDPGAVLRGGGGSGQSGRVRGDVGVPLHPSGGRQQRQLPVRPVPLLRLLKPVPALGRPCPPLPPPRRPGHHRPRGRSFPCLPRGPRLGYPPTRPPEAQCRRQFGGSRGRRRWWGCYWC